MAWGVLLSFGLSDAQGAGAVIGAVAGLVVMWEVERLGRDVAEAGGHVPGTLVDRA